jgi:NAD-dependent SIR2 family protein deacetylase
MRFEELGKQLESKRRTLADLARYVGTRTDGTPNYTVLLGAGCSVTSGIRPATVLCDTWRQEILLSLGIDTSKMSTEEQRQSLREKESSWYDLQREYSSLFEKRYDLQRQRRMFVENEVKDAVPSIGYLYLTALVEQDYFNTVFTTNFDDLVNEAFFLYSQKRPIVCAHDSSINSITVTSRRPKIIKLHGDYLFDDIKATDRETESLDQNMKEKFIEFAKDYGLVVVGYAGGDRSIIDLLTVLLKNEDYFKNGIYWCIRKHSDIPEELRRLFWKDRIYFVEIEGFDELFSELYAEFNNGDCLPAVATRPENRNDAVTSLLLQNESRFPTTTKTLQSAHQRLTRLTKRKALANQIVNPESKEKAIQSSDFTDDELLILTRIQRQLNEQAFKDAIDILITELKASIRPSFKRRLLLLQIDACVGLRDFSAAIKVLDGLIIEEPKRARWHLKKATVLFEREEKYKCYERALELNDQSEDALSSIAEWHIDGMTNVVGPDKATHYEKAKGYLYRAVDVNPKHTSPSWSTLHRLLQDNEQPKPKRESELNRIEEFLEKQHRYSWQLLNLKLSRMTSETDSKKQEQLLKDIAVAKERDTSDDSEWYDTLSLRLMHKCGRRQEAEDLCNKLYSSERRRASSYLADTLITVLRQFFGDEVRAKLVAEEYLISEDYDFDVFSQLFNLLLDQKDHSTALALLEKHKRRLSIRTEKVMYRQYCEKIGNYDMALALIKDIEVLTGKQDVMAASYLLLLAKRPSEAKKLLQGYLESKNFSAEAAAEIVNYELAKKQASGAKPDNGRLEDVLKFDVSIRTKAAVAALRGHKAESLTHIREILKTDKTFRYEAVAWPVFEELQSDESFKKLVYLI